VDINLITNTCL